MNFHDERIRQRDIRGRLRATRAEHERPIDRLYERGEITERAWNVAVQFSYDRRSFLEARARSATKAARQAQEPRRGRPPKATGFNMAGVASDRAERISKIMSSERYSDLLVLIGEIDGEVDTDKAVWTLNELESIYEGGAATLRWEDR